LRVVSPSCVLSLSLALFFVFVYETAPPQAPSGFFESPFIAAIF
jgi:hypothetical protein